MARDNISLSLYLLSTHFGYQLLFLQASRLSHLIMRNQPQPLVSVRCVSSSRPVLDFTNRAAKKQSPKSYKHYKRRCVCRVALRKTAVAFCGPRFHWPETQVCYHQIRIHLCDKVQARGVSNRLLELHLINILIYAPNKFNFKKRLVKCTLGLNLAKQLTPLVAFPSVFSTL